MKKQILLDKIDAECKRQREIWGSSEDDNKDDLIWVAILFEEVGEVAKAVLQYNAEQTETELIQVAAIIQSWLTNEKEVKHNE